MSLARKTAWRFLLICSLFSVSEGCYLTQIATFHLATYTFPQSIGDQHDQCVHLQTKDKNDVIKVTLTTSGNEQLLNSCPHTIFVFDGRSNNTTVLLKVCGAERLTQEVQSSGPDLLVEVAVTDVLHYGSPSVSYKAQTVTLHNSEGMETSTFGTTEIIPLVAVPILVLMFGFIVCSKRRKNQQLRQNIEADGHTAQDLLRAMTVTLEQNGSGCCHHDVRHVTLVDSHHENNDPLHEALIANQRRKVTKGRVRHPAGDVQRDSDDLDTTPYPYVFQPQDPSTVPFLSPYDTTFDPLTNRYDAATVDPRANSFHNSFHDNDTEDNLNLVSSLNGTAHHNDRREYSIPVDPHLHHLSPHQKASDINFSPKPISVSFHPSPSRHRHYSPRPGDRDSTGSSHRAQGHRHSNLNNLSSSSNSVLTFYGPVDRNLNDTLMTSSGTLMTSSGTDISLLDRNEQEIDTEEAPPPTYDEVTCGGRLAPSTNQS